jgi:hypothetical protein
MIARYRSAARIAEELHLGDLAPLDVAVPELRGEDGAAGGGAPPREDGAGERDAPAGERQWSTDAAAAGAGEEDAAENVTAGEVAFAGASPHGPLPMRCPVSADPCSPMSKTPVILLG